MPKICVRLIVTGPSEELNVISKAVSPDNKIGLPTGVTLEWFPREGSIEYNICIYAKEGGDVLTLKSTVNDLVEHLELAKKVYDTNRIIVYKYR
ncbi:MAG: hypothetical protein GSR79_02025 [Desulfurococcales archaeon]|nr:hypothetical protein [Desulfurococcales archaeon]